MVASCADTYTTFGGLIAMQNLVNSANPPAIVSISYGECEAENGASSNAAFNSLYQQAVAEGISVFVSAGDEGRGQLRRQSRRLRRTESAVSALRFHALQRRGGRHRFFRYLLRHATTPIGAAINSAVYGSAYPTSPKFPGTIPAPAALLANFLGYPCDRTAPIVSAPPAPHIRTDSSRSRPEAAAPAAAPPDRPTTTGSLDGTCQGYAKPSWQTGVAGIPNDGVRDIPDVSLFAANGLWGHYYVYCWTDTANGGAPCLGAPSGWAGAGGTSFASPILAGIQALVNQKQGSAQGNPNYVYYKLAAQEYGAQGSSTCDSSNGPSAAAPVAFFMTSRWATSSSTAPARRIAMAM